MTGLFIFLTRITQTDDKFDSGHEEILCFKCQILNTNHPETQSFHRSLKIKQPEAKSSGLLKMNE